MTDEEILALTSWLRNFTTGTDAEVRIWEAADLIERLMTERCRVEPAPEKNGDIIVWVDDHEHRFSPTSCKRAAEEECNQLRRVGGMLSNIAFNLAQDHRLQDYERKMLDNTRKEWDAIRHASKKDDQ
jgi:hypothetical protein